MTIFFWPNPESCVCNTIMHFCLASPMPIVQHVMQLFTYLFRGYGTQGVSLMWVLDGFIPQSLLLRYFIKNEIRKFVIIDEIHRTNYHRGCLSINNMCSLFMATYVHLKLTKQFKSTHLKMWMTLRPSQIQSGISVYRGCVN